MISFPGLGLQVELHPVALSLFGWPIHWYGILIASGFLLAAWFCSVQAKHFGIEPNDLLDLLIFAVPGAIIGARLYYIAFYPALFRKQGGGPDFIKMLRIQDGGLAIYGAVIAAFLIGFLVMRHKNLPFLAIADLGVMGLFIGQSVGRWGNFVNVEAYGGPTDLPWRMEIQQWVDGALQTVQMHPTFLYESIWNLLGFAMLLLLLKRGLRSFDGMFFALYLAWYGVGRGFIEGLRTDSLMLLETGIRVSQMLGFLSALAAIVYLIYRLRRGPGPEEMLVNQIKRTREGP